MHANSDAQSMTPGVLFVLMAAVLWGTTGTSQALAPSAADPLSIGALRMAVGGAGLWGLALLRGGLRTGHPWPLGMTFLTAALVAAYQLSFFAAVKSTGVAVGTMVAIGSSPVFAGVLDTLVLNQRPNLRWLGATACAITGCSLMIVTGNANTVVGSGVILALVAGLSYALYTLTIKQLLRHHTPEAVLAVVFSLGAVLMSPLLLRGEIAWVFQPRGLIVIAHLGLIATALSYWLYARGLQGVPVSTVVSLSLAEPLTAAMLGLFFLQEQVGMGALAGMGLLLSGLILLALPRTKKNSGPS